MRPGSTNSAAPVVNVVRLNLRVVAGGADVAASTAVQQVARLVDAGFKEKRAKYTAEQKCRKARAPAG